jgi:UDP-N-acetylmuramoyl-L-alanyl-D-glutamate--2,6-diaminopimelate ligase
MMVVAPESGLNLSALLAGFGDVPPAADCAVEGLCSDSRRVNPGDCFFALSGTREHGARYARAAVAGGAVVILIEELDIPLAVDVPVVVVPHLRAQIGAIADRFYASPSLDLTTIGITGTNGKTTVAHLCAQALESMDRSCGYIGTLGAGRLEALRPSQTTTPGPLDLHRTLATFRDDGLYAAALEISSHALTQGRIDGVRLDVAAFTNLGHDHLDYHGDLDAYAHAKRSLFDRPGIEHAVVNVDQALGRSIVAGLDRTVDCWVFGSGGSCASVSRARKVAGRRIVADAGGCTVGFASPFGDGSIRTRLLGDFNGRNVLGALTVLLALGVPLADAGRALEAVAPICGRMERFGGVRDLPTVVVDYAHTPDSLEAVLTALRALNPGRLHCVFGCGGDRDQTKRPLMGAVAARLADKIVVTSDNPRSEPNSTIVGHVIAGMKTREHILVIEDREEAIRHAITGALKGDIVLVAGKGHENEQEVLGVRRPFQDQAVVRAALEEYTS